MVEFRDDTEKQILEAAEDEFVQEGLSGARMQSIANRAGINKSLLHYYFRSKEKLFTYVFTKVFKKIVPEIEALMNKEESLIQKIERFIDQYIDIISKNPFIPIFILQELSKNPERLGNIVLSTGIDPSKFFSRVEESVAKGEIVAIKPQHLITNIIGLCVFPFIARPILQKVLFSDDKKAYSDFLEQRKKEVTQFVIFSIKNSN